MMIKASTSRPPVTYARSLGRLYPLISDGPAITTMTPTESDEVYLKPPMLPFASWPSIPAGSSS